MRRNATYFIIWRGSNPPDSWLIFVIEIVDNITGSLKIERSLIWQLRCMEENFSTHRRLCVLKDANDIFINSTANI